MRPAFLVGGRSSLATTAPLVVAATAPLVVATTAPLPARSPTPGGLASLHFLRRWDAGRVVGCNYFKAAGDYEKDRI